MHMISRKTIIASAIALVTGSAGALAAQDKSASFEKADRDRNGSVSYQEADYALGIDKKLFSAADVNRDDTLTRNEYARAQMLKEQSGQQASAQSKTQGAQASGQAQMKMQASSSQAGAKIKVEEQASKIKVSQPEPKITVEQPAPNVTVKQPKPIVNVQSPEPQVEVKSAQPEVRVVEKGQPEVEIRRTGEAETTFVQTDSDKQQRTEMQDKDKKAGLHVYEDKERSGKSTLMSKRVSEIKGMEVESAKDEDIGDVEKLVKDTKTNKVYAVVSVGGLLGIGDKHIALPLEDMELRDDELWMTTGQTEDQIEDSQRYIADNYTELDDNMSLSEAMGQRAQAGSQMGSSQRPEFAEIDNNGDGYISKSEAESNETLKLRWKAIDNDNDQRIDRVEFSAFEKDAGN